MSHLGTVVAIISRAQMYYTHIRSFCFVCDGGNYVVFRRRDVRSSIRCAHTRHQHRHHHHHHGSFTCRRFKPQLFWNVSSFPPPLSLPLPPPHQCRSAGSREPRTITHLLVILSASGYPVEIGNL